MQPVAFFGHTGGTIRRFLCSSNEQQPSVCTGRPIRIVGPDGARSLPLIRDKTLGEYDVVVDDTPTSPNQKEANWAIIQPLLAIFKDQLMQNPKVFAEMLEYSPLPSRLVEMIKKFVNESETDPAKANRRKAERLAAEEAEAAKAKPSTPIDTFHEDEDDAPSSFKKREPA